MKKITTNTLLSLSSDDFGVVILDSEVQVPNELAKVLERMNIGHLDTFLTMLWAFPHSFAAALNWEIQQVRNAYNSLSAKVGFTHDDVLLDPNDGC
jgi:hypothetical protein